MKRLIVFTLLLTAAFCSFSQSQTDQDYNKMAKKFKPSLGVKGGYNIARVTGSTPNFKPDTKNGFMVAGFFALRPKSGLGYRTELVFSRQGFEFDENNKVQKVTNDYIYMPHFTTFGISKFFQIHLGAQIGYLLKSSKTNTTDNSSKDISDFYNKLDYGASGGVEIYPVAGLILGGRYNMSFGSLYKHYENMSTTSPNYVPFPLPFTPNDVKTRNAVINFYAGYRF